MTYSFRALKTASLIIICFLVLQVKVQAQTPYLVADINPGRTSSSIRYLTSMGTNLFFTANDGTNGTELWKYDGISATMVADIKPGSATSNPKHLTVIGTNLIFTANDGTNGTELWKYDGTSVTMLADITPGNAYSDPNNLTVIGTNLYFNANDGVNGSELWKYDGTSVSMVANINPGSGYSSPNYFKVIGSDLFFRANDGVNGTELWKYDGTSATMVANINPGAGYSSPNNLTVVGANLFFTATDGINGAELWMSDGDTAIMVADINPGAGSSISYLVALGSDLYFRADDGINGAELWKSDGDTAIMVADINPGSGSTYMSELTVLGSEVFFQAIDGTHGQEVWKFDGTTASLVADVNPGAAGSIASGFTPMGSDLFFRGYIGPFIKTFKYDGDTVVEVTGVSSPGSFITVDTNLYFSAYEYASGNELWSLNHCSIPPAPKDVTPVDNLSTCDSASTILKVTGYGDIKWYDAATGGNYLGDGLSYTTGNISSRTTFYVQDSVCGVSPTRTSITVNAYFSRDSSVTVDTCLSYTSPSGKIFTTSNTILDTISTVHGCDSIITINLTIYNPKFSTINLTECASLTSPSGNYVWKTDGTYQDTLFAGASNGCDSILTVHLTITRVHANISLSSCDSIISPSGNYSWFTTGIYQDTVTSISGCDSVLTINLTLFKSTYDTVYDSALNTYTGLSGVTWQTGGTYRDTIQNLAGCDSITTYNLKICGTQLVLNTNDSGIGSLRQAIEDACTGDTIRFDPSIISGGSDTLVLSTGIINASKSLTIIGLYNATDTLYISSPNSMFNFSDVSYVVLDSLVIIDSRSTAIRFNSIDSIIVRNSILRGNGRYSSIGGAIYIRHDTSVSVLIENSTISNNTCRVYGAGIYLSTSGTGLSNISIINSTLSGNLSSRYAGGVCIRSSNNTNLTVLNSTLARNVAIRRRGPAIWFQTSSTASNFISIKNSTLSGNTGRSNSNPIGGALHLVGNATLEYSSSIFNNGTNNFYTQSTSTVTAISGGHNIFSDSTIATIASDSINITDAQLKLLPLAFNGGFTQTMLPDSGSIAVDRGNPADFSNAQNTKIYGNGRDIGAAETTCQVAGNWNHTVVVCKSYVFNGITYTSNNSTAKDTLLSAGGCDSILTLNLTILKATYNTITTTVCNSYTGLDGTTWTTSGTYLDTITNSKGCDSITSYNLTINHESTNAVTITACDSYTGLASTTWTASGTYIDTITNSKGCDSITTYNLTINYKSTNTITATVCNSYTGLAGTSWTTSGTYIDTITNSNGCDSITSYNLTINHESTNAVTITACDSYTGLASTTWTASGTYIDTITNSNGCDSVTSYNLTINHKSTNTITATVCNSYTGLAGSSWTTSGTYIDTITNSNGCDSITSYNLTINHESTNAVTATVCNSYTGLAGTSWTASGIYIDTITNSNGCDSITTYNLTINYKSYAIDIQTACNSYTWIDGNTYTASNNTARHTLINSFGCDSIVSLNLTVNYDATSNDVITACDSYTWLNGTTYTVSNFTDTVMYLTSSGCDSIVTLNLTIKGQKNSSSIYIVSCGIYDFNGFYISATGTYYDTINNSAGCDSAITLSLTVVDLDNSVTVSGGSLSSNHTGGTYQWVDCNNGFSPILGETNQSFTASTNGSYAVIISDLSCTDTSDCKDINNVGVSKKLNQEDIKLYPNPTKNLVNLYLPTENKKYSIKIFDMVGKLVHEENYIGNNMTIDVSIYTSGQYSVVISNEQTIIVKKLIKE